MSHVVIPVRPQKRGVAMAVAAIAVVANILALTATAATANAQTATCTVSATLVNSCRPWLGAAANSYPQAAADTQSQIQYHEQRIGRPLDIVHTYHSIGVNYLSAADVYYATRPQTMLYANWKPTDKWANIANQNAGIDQMAASIKSLGDTRIFLTLWHEPENDVSPGGDPNCPDTKYKGSAGTVSDYTNMWRYTEARFATDGVHNVVWVMNYLNYSPFDCLVPDLWPGNDYVDWVMFNAYDNATPGSFTSPVNRFAGVLAAAQNSTHDFASKPWGIAEWGTTLTPAQDQAFYVSAKAAVDGNTLPKIKAYVVYDSDSGTVPANQDLRVAYDADHTADPTKADDYTAFASDPALSGSYDPPPPLPDVTPPTVSLTAPTDGDQVSGAVTVNGAASDDRGVARVNLLVDGQDSTVGAATPAPSFALTWGSTGVANGTHTLQLTATDAAGNVAHSGVVTVTVVNADTSPPSAPTQLKATTATSGEVDLSWVAATDNVGVDHYVVYRDGVMLGRTADATTTFADTGVAAATQYSYQVSAVDAAQNEGNQSSPLAVTTPAAADVTAPSAPTGLTAVPASKSEIDLHWNSSTDNVGVTGYHVYRDGNVMATVSATSWADTALTEASTHSYAITALDAAGNESLPSPTVQASTPDVTAPSVPGGLAATTVGAGEIDLGWTAATDNVAVTGYHVYRDGNLITTLGPVTGYADRSVSGGHTYSYRVDAFDGAGNVGTPTAPVTASTRDTTAPTKPTGVTAVSTGSSRVQVTWSAASDDVGVAGYQVYRDGAALAMVGGPSTTYTDASVTDGRTYSYSVSAYDAAGNASGASLPATVTSPDRTAPTVPSGLAGRAVSGTQVSLTWNPSTDNVAVSGYNLFRGGVKIATLTGTTYSDSGLTNATAYVYTVSAYDAAGNTSPLSGAATVTTTDTTAPARPAKPTVTAQAYNKVTVTWTAATDNVGVAGYRVYRNATQVATVVGATSYVDATVAGASTYSYTVSAYDAAGNVSAQSTATSVTTPAAPDTIAPTVPTGLKATITSTKAVSLSWTASTDNVRVVGYSVYRNGALLATSAKANYTDASAVQGASYSYTVSAYDSAGNASANTTPLAVTVPDATPPTAPTRLTLSPGPRTIVLNWLAATDNVRVAGYNIWRNGIKIGSVTTGTTYNDKGLVTGTRYSYYIVAYDPSGNLSPPSATVSGAPR